MSTSQNRPLGQWLSRLARAHERRAAIRELRRLDERALADVGIRRELIVEVVDAMLRQPATERAHVQPTHRTVPPGRATGPTAAA